MPEGGGASQKKDGQKPKKKKGFFGKVFGGIFGGKHKKQEEDELDLHPKPKSSQNVAVPQNLKNRQTR